MSCIEQIKYEILLDKTTYKDAREYIMNNSDEIFYVSPGYKIFKDYHIIGVPPIALGAKGNALVFTYTKPCYGTFVLTIDNSPLRARRHPLAVTWICGKKIYNRLL